MLLDRSHFSWSGFTLLATIAAVGLYCGCFHPTLLPWLHVPAALAMSRSQHLSVGNSPLGLAYGVIAYAIFIFAVLLGVRRKYPQVRVGRAQTWLRAHIWLTILTLPLVFMHAAFRFGSVMTSSLMWLYLLVMLSGFYGLALQQFLPRHMRERLTLETIYDEIPYLTQRLLTSALALRDELRSVSPAFALTLVPATAGPAIDDQSVATLLDAVESEVLPYLAARHPSRAALADGSFADDFFRRLHLRVSRGHDKHVDLLATWCRERHQMLLQARYHRRLHAWLLVHVPASILLIILTGWHAVVALVLY